MADNSLKDIPERLELSNPKLQQRPRMKGFLRHNFVYKVLRVILTPYLKWKFNYQFKTAPKIKKPYIVLSNHVTDYDCLLVGLSFPEMMYYVASEHIFRWVHTGKLINYLVSPIPKAKATKEMQTAKEIIRRLKTGANVCLFAEGNRTFNGETCAISESTGKLIKLCGVTLFTYRLHGGYLSSPRWSKTLRRGAMSGGIVKEYTPEMIRSMTVDEINSAIFEDVYVDAYEDQKNKPIEYKGKNLAEQLETALYICPRCDAMGTLFSKDDRFMCSCGLNYRISASGYFETDNHQKPVFKTVLEWSKWQDSRILEKARSYIESIPHKPIITDHGQTVSCVDKTVSRVIGSGNLELYHDRLVFVCKDEGTHTFEFKNISDVAIHGQMVLILSTTDKESYEFRSDHPRSALKYVHLFRAFSFIEAQRNIREE